MKKLSGWVFMYNEFTENWQAAKREDAKLLYNDISNKKVLKSKSIDTLFYLIRSTGGNLSKINSIK